MFSLSWCKLILGDVGLVSFGGARLLGRALALNRSLVDLRLVGNQGLGHEEGAVEELADGVAKQAGLVRLVLNGCSVADPGECLVRVGGWGLARDGA